MLFIHQKNQRPVSRAAARAKQVLLALFFAFAAQQVTAQTTLTTESGTNFTGGAVASGNSAITFVIENTNSYDIMLTGLDQYWRVANTGAVPTLWYSATSLSGAPTITAPAWSAIATGAPLTITAAGYYPTFSNLAFVIPANTQYRFAVQSSNGTRFTGTAGPPSPATFSAAGVNLKLHNTQIAGQNVGYGGAFPSPASNPRAFTGRIHFEPAAACAGTPAPGNTLASANPVCAGAMFWLSAQNATAGTGVTYQWESADDAAFTSNVTALGTGAVQNASQTSTKFYRVTVSCGGNSSTSVPVEVTMAGLLNCYCASYPTDPADEDITNVTFGQLSNSSACTGVAPGPGSFQNHYANYTTLPPVNVMQGETVPFSVSISNCSGNLWPSGFAIFLDHNQNGTFDLPGERMYVTPTDTWGNYTQTGSITIPAAAATGTTLLRIVAVETQDMASIAPCGAYSWGETEDYLVTINPPGCISSGTYTINQNLPAGSGNFNSLTDALNALQCGISGPVVFNVAPGSGPYTGQILLGQISGSSALNTVTLNGNGETLSFCGNSANRDIVRLHGTDNFTLNGFTLNAACNFAWGVHLMGDLENVTISNNTVNLSAAHSLFIGNMNGIVAGNSAVNPQSAGGLLSGITVTGNTIINGYHGIRLEGAAALLGTNVTVSNNTLTTPTAAGIDVRNLSNPSVTGNAVTMRTGNGFQFANSAGITVVNTENGLTFTGNKVTNAGTLGAYLFNVNRQSTTPGLIANNLLGGGFQNNAKAYALQLNNASYLDVYFNSTLADNAATGSGFYVSNQFSQFLNVQNNSFAFTGPGAGYALQANNGNANFLTLNHNNYHSTGPKFVRFSGADRADLNSLQTAPGPAGHNAQSLAHNPHYLSATDLHLQITSPLIAQGAAIPAVTVDYDGHARPAAPAIGADEPGIAPREAAAATAAAQVFPNPFVQQLTVTVTAAEPGQVQVVLTDLPGRQVFQQSYAVGQGASQLQLQPAKELPQGVYLLQVRLGEAINSYRVVKQ